VSDAVRAIIACGTIPAAAGGRFLIAGPALDLRVWLEAIAAAAATAVRFHDRLDGPARAVARAASLLPWAVRQGRRWQTLDYLVRPRSYDTAASLDRLGPYQQADLGPAVTEAMAWYRDRGFAV
jgi:nucleoside-diphosphate-sugar epimerase